MNKRSRARRSILGFYGRKFLFFSLLLLAGWAVYVFVSNNNSQADQSPIISGDATGDKDIAVGISTEGSVTIDGEESDKKINFLADGDELRTPVIDQSGVSMPSLKITLTLPGDVAYQTSHEVLAIHGAGATNSYVSDSKTIIYEIDDVSGYATVSIVAKMPKGTIKANVTQQIQTNLASKSFNYWLIAAIALPSFTFVFMVFFLLIQTKRQKIEIPDKPINAPPMAIPPALVGVLMHQKVRSREIAATLIDMAIRGDILIIDRERGFAFGKGKFDKRLLGYEKILLSKIFRNNLSADRIEIEQRINNHFYSKKISLVSAGIYALTTRLGYFKTNPQSVHAKYRFFGILAFLLGLTGFGLSFAYFPNPPYVVFFWIGMMISAVVITGAASYIPIRTPLGQEELTNWLAFKKFLSSPEPMVYSQNLAAIFQNYLPYAIVMDCEAAWAKRFSDHNFEMPTWFLTEKGGLALEDFCLSLFPIISYVSRSFVALREPGFE